MSEIRTLYGDNEHDDTQALQDYIDGKAVWFNGEMISRAGDGAACVPPGVFKITDSVKWPLD